MHTKKPISLVLEITSMMEGFFDINDETFSTHYTDLKGLEALIQNADTVQIYCSQDISTMLLLNPRINADHVIFHYLNLYDRCPDVDVIQILIDPYVEINERYLVEIYVPRSLDLDVRSVLNTLILKG